jgi:2-polyprenyl-3-methyl-5-hydroxy-6-metoxy-1,4-benzoquinol methylase
LTRRPENRAASSLAPIAKIVRPNGVACSSTPNTTARTANSTMVFGMAVPAALPNARSVHSAGKSVTDASPMTT